MIPPGLSSQSIGQYRVHLRGDPCAYCGASGEVLDHVDPRKRGGRDTFDNLTSACARCNGLKHARSLLGFLGLRRNESSLDDPSLHPARARELRARWGGVGVAW